MRSYMVREKCASLPRDETKRLSYPFRTMDLVLMPTNCHTCSSGSIERGMVTSSILVARVLDWLSARPSWRHMGVLSGQRAACRALQSPSRCRLFHCQLMQRRWSSRWRRGGIYDNESEANSAG